MNEKLLHTPEGVRDVYDTECKKKLKIIDKLHNVMERYSYHDIETPTFEYFDIFNCDKGSAKSNEMYKLFDRENNTLVLRPDMTPSIARCVAKYYAEDNLPIRLCYQGNTYKNIHNLQGKLKESTELGGELVNDDSSAADAEILATVIDCFLASGLKEFQIEIGNVNFFKGLIAEAQIDADEEENIRSYINNKNSFGLSNYVKTLELKPEIESAFSDFDSLFGGLDMLERAKRYVTNEVSLEAISRLERVYQALSIYGYEKYIGFDLGMLSHYKYYTGIIFRGYTYGTGAAIVKGGRYNNLLKQFGKDAPAIGFSFNVDELMLSLSRQRIEVAIEYTDVLMLYPREYQETGIVIGKMAREQGHCVELVRMSTKSTIEDYLSYARKHHFHMVFYVEDNNNVKVYDIKKDLTEQTVEVSYLKSGMFMY